MTLPLDPFDHGQSSIRFVPASAGESDSVRERLARGWAVGAVRGIESHARPSRAASRTHRCHTEAGIFVLRQGLLAEPGRQALLEELAAWLRERGIPVPGPVPTREGRPFLVEGGNVHSLVPFVAAEHFDGSRAELLAAAELLARLHIALADCPLAAALRRWPEPYPWSAEEVDRLHALARSGGEPFDRRAAADLDLLRERAPAAPEGLDVLPQQVGHFDLHPHNLLFDAHGQVVAVLDLDLARVGERARDVAIAMHKHARVFGPLTERGQDPLGTLAERARAFVGRYGRTSPLASAEIRALPYLAFDEARRRMLYILRRHYRERSTASDFDLPKQRAQLEEALELQEAFRTREPT